MEKGTLIEFRLHGDRRLAVIERSEGKKNWVVTDARGQSHTLHPRQFSYTVPGQRCTSGEIDGFLREAESYLDPSSLEVAWELLVEDGEAVVPGDLAELLFSEQGPAPCYAAYCLLSDDKIYFKQKGDKYEPRSATQVTDLKHQIEREQQRLQERQDFYNRIEVALAGEGVEWQESDRPWLNALERLAVLGDEANNKATAHEVLTELGRPKTQASTFQLLVDLQLWSPHENLFLKQYQAPIQFPAGVAEMAATWLRSPIADPDESQRLDLTHLKVSTIDDESTREIDDGLSVEFLEDGRQRIWVHIADPTRWITIGDAIDLEARRRATTIYLPTGMIPMFPPELATGPMSLVQGTVCHALSFGVILDEMGAIADYEIHPSLIKPTYRLTYDDVDEILQLGVQAEPELEALYQWSKRREAWRMDQGAVSIRLPEASIKVRDDDVSITVLEDSASRQMVAEMMILTGEVAGCYGKTHNLALPFRGQPQPELPPEEELMVLPAGPVRDSAIRRCMSRSEMGVMPLRHAGLGLDTYTQATSPIRRYTDLLCHFQIKAHLRGDAVPFSPAQLQEVVQVVSGTAYEAVKIERQTNRYWGMEYLRRHDGEIWQALMLLWLREHENLGLVLLEELGLEMVVRFQRAVPLGDRLDLKVTHADPRQDIIQFAEVTHSPASEAV